MQHNQEVCTKDITYHNVTVYGLTYRGFWTYGKVEINGVEYAVKTFEAWSSWEIC